MRSSLGWCGAVVVAAGIAFSTLAVSAGGDDAIKFRQAVMTSIGTHMGALGAMAKGEVAVSEQAKWHAGALIKLSGIVPQLFPAGSGAGKTGALSVIWENTAKFQQVLADFQAATPQLMAAAESGDAAQIGAALGAVGKTCGGCHETFRKKHDH
jgi:cytochrome c556